MISDVLSRNFAAFFTEFEKSWKRKELRAVTKDSLPPSWNKAPTKPSGEIGLDASLFDESMHYGSKLYEIDVFNS